MIEPLRFVFRKEKDILLEKLGYYGIKKLPYLLVESGKEKIRGYTGMLSIEEIHELNNTAKIEVIGLYLFHDYSDGIRLSFDAISALKDQITKNILELSDEQAEEFLKGRDIALAGENLEKLKDEPRGFKIIRSRGEFIGTGKLTIEGRIVNYMPKERRLR